VILLWTPVFVKGFIRILQERISSLDFDQEIVVKKDDDKLMFKPKSKAGGVATVVLTLAVICVARFINNL
jgi:hypothetical protein